MRQRMEQHRANPTCAVATADGPTRFRAGELRWSWRLAQLRSPGSGPIDSSGALPDGTKFNGPAGLREVLMRKQDLFVETFTERLLTYALGRGLEE